MAKNRHDLATDWLFSSLDFWWKILYRLPNHSLLLPDELASRAPRSNWKGFDSSGRISRVIYRGWISRRLATFTSIFRLSTTETTVSRCECVCFVLNREVCGKHMITQSNRSIFETNKYRYKSCFEYLIRNSSTGS